MRRAHTTPSANLRAPETNSTFQSRVAYPAEVHERIRTFKARRGRLTARHRATLAHFADRQIALSRLPELDEDRPIALEIGCGRGESAIHLAHQFPHTQWIAIDVHTPGIAALLAQVAIQEIPNLFVVEADVFNILRSLPRLQGVHSYFPDPWPKTKHHKRRLITAERLDDITERLEPGAAWNIATDWQEYAAWIAEVFAADSRWSGGVIDRPDRPITGYERKAHDAGRRITDLRFSLAIDGSHSDEH